MLTPFISQCFRMILEKNPSAPQCMVGSSLETQTILRDSEVVTSGIPDLKNRPTQLLAAILKGHTIALPSKATISFVIRHEIENISHLGIC